MNLVNTYLLLPLQRKIFKNFGHYDYQTSTFHLNEERVNEVFFDPAFNPFVDVLRETSHASAVASSKAAAPRTPSPQKKPNVCTRPRSDAINKSNKENSSFTRTPASENASTHGGSTAQGEFGTTSTDPLLRRPPPPCVQLLQGKLRSAGLLSFLRQATTQKSLAVEAIDLVFSVAAAATENRDTEEEKSTSSEAAAVASDASRSDGVSSTLAAAASPPLIEMPSAPVDAKGSDETPRHNTNSSAKASADWQELDESTVAVMARSYSLEDQFSLFHSQPDPSQDTLTTQLYNSASSDTTTTTPASNAASPSTTTASTSSFHTVGDLMRYLKSQLQGLTIGVEEVRLTFCIPPAGAACATAAPTPTQQRSAEEHTAVPPAPLLLEGARVVHFSCRRGLRFTVDEAAGAAVEDMQCSAVVNDWQCYLHVMKADGPVPTAFSLDELILTTTAHVGSPTAAAAAAADGRSSSVHATSDSDTESATAPITLRLARRSVPLMSANGNTSSPSPSPSPPQPPLHSPTILLDVEATGGCSMVLTATQVAHLADVAQLITAATAPPAQEVDGGADEETDSGAASHLRDEVEAAPLESGEAVTAAALAATELQSATKYICVHSAGCSVTLLTQAALTPGVVAQAWSGALLPQQLALLTDMSGAAVAGTVAATSPSRRPVFDALAFPHFTYVMREVDVLFPSVDAGAASSSSALSRVFAADRKKRAIYRNLFKNNLADPAVTEQLTRATRAEHHNGAQSLFLGIGSIALMEYRQAAVPSAAKKRPASRVLRPAQLLHAERSPYALVLFHRSTPPLPEKASSSLSSSVSFPAGHSMRADGGPPTNRAASPFLFCVHQETVVVGLASIVMQLDTGLLEVLTTYATTLLELTNSLAVTTGAKRSSALKLEAQGPHSLSPPPHQRQASRGETHHTRVRSSVKVLFESLETSVRFPLYSSTTTDGPTAPPPLSFALSSSCSPPSPAAPPPTPLSSAALPSLLARLLQRLRDTSVHTHRQLRMKLAREEHVKGREAAQRLSGKDTASRPSDTMHCVSAVLEKLGFPEDVEHQARFLPEFLRFSIRDLQLVQTSLPSRSMEVSATAASESPCTSVKWREAVAYMHDVLEETKSELFRVDYSPEMSIRVTHACLPDEAVRDRWQALRRVLTLQVRLGDITTTVLTQDDLLLASYYVQELLETLSHCRQRLHAIFGEEAEQQSTPGIAKARLPCAAPPPTVCASASVAKAKDNDEFRSTGSSAMSHVTRQQIVADGDQASDVGRHLHPAADLVGGTVAEAFAIADAQQAAISSEPRSQLESDVDGDMRSAVPGVSSPLLRCASDVLALVPDVWRHHESTCTALDVQIGRVRLGLFAPRLSPMGEVVGEPLFRCLPAAQRRQMVDLNCLYHTYIVEVVGVSVSGLVGSGALIGQGQDIYLRARCSGVSLWERQPLSLPATANGGAAGGGAPAGATVAAAAAAAASSSLYSSNASGVTQLSSDGNDSHGSRRCSPQERQGGPGARRDLGSYYYSSNQQPLHRSSTLVQLVQSYAEVKPTAEEDDDELLSAYGGIRGGTLQADERFLCVLWSFYLRELKSRRSDAMQVATEEEELSRASCPAGGGVCEVHLLAYTAGERDADVPPSALRTARGTRHVSVQLAGLGLHHTVAYNGDHLAAVLGNYFSAGESTAATEHADASSSATAGRDVSSADLAAQSVAEGCSGTTATPTVVRMELVNLMATYRPRGVGRSLAVVLLPRASVVIHAPASAPPPTQRESDRKARYHRAGVQTRSDDAGAAASLPPLALQAEAWLHTSLPIYVCNDCEVEALAREVLDPTESDDWAADLEGAGFVRLCEVVSTAPPVAETGARTGGPPFSAFSPSDAASLPRRQATPRRPNLTVTLPQPDTAAALELQDENGSSGAADNEGAGFAAERETGMAVRVRYLELSAFMAKDAFDVFRELVETWGAGTDLQVMDTPAALVMRSGPGFAWVAEEVARSCAPMTFRLNPALTQVDCVRKCGGQHASLQDRSASGTHPASGADASRQMWPLVSSSTATAAVQRSDASSTSLSPLGLRQESVTSAGRAAGATASGDVSATLPTYGYHTWRDALHAAQGRDQRLAEAYQLRVAQLLDKKATWVPVRRSPVPQSNDDAKGSYTPAATPVGSAAAANVTASSTPSQLTTVHDTIFIPGDEAEEEKMTAVQPTRSTQTSTTTAAAAAAAATLSARPPPSLPPQRSLLSPAAVGISSVSSSFSDLSELEAMLAPLQWHIMPASDSGATFSETVRHLPVAAALVANGAAETVENYKDEDDDDDFDLCAACERQPHFLSCWSRDRSNAASSSCPVSLHHLERTDDALLHDTAERYLYPPVALQLFLCDCAVNVSLYEGTDLMAAAVRKQRQGYLQIVSRGSRVAAAAPPVAPYSMSRSADNDELRRKVGGGTSREPRGGNEVGRVAGRQSRAAGDSTTATTKGDDWQTQILAYQSSRSIPGATAAAAAAAAATEAATAEPPSESSASRLSRLNTRGCRSGFGDRDASKRLVLSCRGITVQLDTFPQASEEDLWFHVVVGEATVFDCIETSDVHRLLTATPGLSPVARSRVAAMTACGASFSSRAASVDAGPRCAEADMHVSQQLELTGLLTSSKSVHMAASQPMADDTRASFTVSHFQQGGSELSLVVRLQPTSLTWSGASVDFAQSFFLSSTATASTPSPPVSPSSASIVAAANTNAAADDGVISGTEAPPIFFRRVVVLPTTLTVAGSFQSDKGVLAALAEGKSLDALRSVPVLSWISVQAIPLPIPFMCIEDCSSTATLLQRIVEDSNCVSIRFLITALCCGLQPLSAVARVGEAAKGLLLLPLSQYRGAAFHHAIRTASSVFMQELLMQTSGVAALLASGSYHASRSLLEVLVSPSDRRLAITAEPSRASQPSGMADGWRQGQEQLRTGLEEALMMASYCTGPDGSLLRLPAAALRMLMGISGAATTTLWGVRNSQSGAVRERDGYIYKK